jgi:LysR family glycine cleavage system transcriptional activator
MTTIREMHESIGNSFHRRLPPMHALTVFAVAAASRTFSRAADQLFVTQGAVSRQIQQLEAFLGCPLFVRHKSGLKLTPEGEALLPVVHATLGRLADACDELRTVGQVMVLRMPPTFTARWFLPRLPELRALLPDVDVRITTHDAWEPAFDRSDVDAAVVRGTGQWPGVEAIPLMREVQSPVCSPAMAAKLRTSADLIGLPLLHTDPLDAWERWLQANGVSTRNARRGQTFDTLDLALAAATRGQGVAISDLILAEESLRDGILVAPFAQTIDQGLSYCLVYPPDRAQQPKIRILREWLVESARRQGEPAPSAAIG